MTGSGNVLLPKSGLSPPTHPRAEFFMPLNVEQFIQRLTSSGVMLEDE